MKFVVGDIGNSEIKLCLLDYNYKIIKKICFETNKIKQKNFLKKKIKLLIKSYEIIAPIFFSSVVPSAYKKIKKIFYKNFQISCKELKQIDFNKIIKTKVNKKQIGSDRIANAIGAFYFYKSNCIIIDFGTATTFDVVIKGVYKGGIIAPGLKLSLNTLVKKAELIPSISLKKVKKVIGNNTINALRSGFFWGYTGLIYNIVKLIKKESNCKFMIILTGGFSHLFKNSLKSKALIDSEITIKGLIKILKTKII
tara:strand:+ start:345 stop:1103 length:759 start_codon:yes stop_codon:yes gene_type:complete